MHVLADKPMAIDGPGFDALVRAFADARERGVLLYDIMTERFEITTMLQKAFSRIPEVFGELLQGSAAEPAVVKESVHYFWKLVSGLPVKRPAWFFDVEQQGEGLVDITTHLVDLVQWECFPAETLDFSRDVAVLAAKRWPTGITPAQLERLTQLPAFPEFLRKYVEPEGNLRVYANGEIDYRIKGVHAKVRVLWNYEAPPGAGDTHYSVMRGSKATLVIRQGAAEGWQPTLYIEPATSKVAAEMPALLEAAMPSVRAAFNGVDVERAGSEWRVLVPEGYHVGHEAHFGQVASAFLRYVGEGALPSWEVPNMIAKYHTTTRALALAHGA
jgi:predicted dehydrogenase